MIDRLEALCVAAEAIACAKYAVREAYHTAEAAELDDEAGTLMRMADQLYTIQADLVGPIAMCEPDMRRLGELLAPTNDTYSLYRMLGVQIRRGVRHDDIA